MGQAWNPARNGSSRPRHVAGPTRPATLVRAAIALISTSPAVRAAEPLGLSSFLPITIEDAYPSKSTTLKPYIRYEADAKGGRARDLVEAVPRATVPLTRGLAVTVDTPYRFGNAPSSGGGNARVGALWNFLSDDGGPRPALAVHGRISAPYGAGPHPTETILRFVATKSLGGDVQTAPRLDLNVSWLHLVGPGAGEPRDRYTWGVGSTVLIGPNTALAADFYQEHPSRTGRNVSLVEAGVRQGLAKGSLLAFGVGTGIGHASPRLRLLGGVEVPF